MTQKEWLKAVKLAKRKRLGDEAEDFAQWLAIEWFEGHRQHQSISESIIDWKRMFWGRSQARKNFTHNKIEIQPWHKASKPLDADLPAFNALDVIHHSLKGSARDIAKLMYVAEYTGPETAQKLGYTVDYVYQRILHARQGIKKYLRVHYGIVPRGTKEKLKSLEG